MNDSKQMTSSDALIKMINQIASNLAPGRSQIDAASATAEHVIRFWARSMKFQLISLVKNKHQALNPTAVRAVAILKKHYDDVLDE